MTKATGSLAVDRHGGWSALLGALIEGRDLTRDEAAAAMHDVLSGQATDAQLAGLLIGLRAKGETVDELTGLATAMVDAAQPLAVPSGAVDIVGTGGSRHRRRHALNVSTMACFVAAGAGAVMCKHGNKKASSTSGSFDLLEALGVRVDLGPVEVTRCLDELGLGFAFARTFHPAMRHAGPVRSELGVPTVFNLLGPLGHPGRIKRQVIGTASVEQSRRMAEVLRAMGAERAMVLTGDQGVDELTTTGPATVIELRDGALVEVTVDPAQLGLDVVALDALAGGDAEANAAIARRVLGGEPGSFRDIVLLNASAALVVAGVAEDLRDGLALAADSIDSGAARDRLDRLVALTTSFG